MLELRQHFEALLFPATRIHFQTFCPFPSSCLQVRETCFFMLRLRQYSASVLAVALLSDQSTTFMQTHSTCMPVSSNAAELATRFIILEKREQSSDPHAILLTYANTTSVVAIPRSQFMSPLLLVRTSAFLDFLTHLLPASRRKIEASRIAVVK